jgi:hypothetical protein
MATVFCEGKMEQAEADCIYIEMTGFVKLSSRGCTVNESLKTLFIYAIADGVTTPLDELIFGLT